MVSDALHKHGVLKNPVPKSVTAKEAGRLVMYVRKSRFLRLSLRLDCRLANSSNYRAERARADLGWEPSGASFQDTILEESALMLKSFEVRCKKRVYIGAGRIGAALYFVKLMRQMSSS